MLIFRGEIARIARQCQLVAATVALAGIPVGQEGGVMIVSPAAHLPGPLAQWAGDAHLGGNRLADELALVGQLVQEIRELLFDLECDDFGLRMFMSHESAFGWRVGYPSI